MTPATLGPGEVRFGEAWHEMARGLIDALTPARRAFHDLGLGMDAAAAAIAVDLDAWLRENRYLLDRRRYNRARRKAVRAVLAGLARR